MSAGCDRDLTHARTTGESEGVGHRPRGLARRDDVETGIGWKWMYRERTREQPGGVAGAEGSIDDGSQVDSLTTNRRRIR